MPASHCQHQVRFKTRRHIFIVYNHSRRLLTLYIIHPGAALRGQEATAPQSEVWLPKWNFWWI